MSYRLLTVFHSPSSPFAGGSPRDGLSSAGGPRVRGPPLSGPPLGPDLQLSPPPSVRSRRSSLRSRFPIWGLSSLSSFLGPDLQSEGPRSSLGPRGPRSSPPRGPRPSPLGPLSSRGPRSSLPPLIGPSLSPRWGPLSSLS